MKSANVLVCRTPVNTPGPCVGCGILYKEYMPYTAKAATTRGPTPPLFFYHVYTFYA